MEFGIWNQARAVMRDEGKMELEIKEVMKIVMSTAFIGKGEASRVLTCGLDCSRQRPYGARDNAPRFVPERIAHSSPYPRFASGLRPH